MENIQLCIWQLIWECITIMVSHLMDGNLMVKDKLWHEQNMNFGLTIDELSRHRIEFHCIWERIQNQSRISRKLHRKCVVILQYNQVMAEGCSISKV